METEAAATSQAEEAAFSTTQAVAETTTATQNTSNAQAAEEEQMSLAEARKLRKESQALRDRLAEAEAKAKQYEQAQMSEEEKRQARLQELEQENQRLAQAAKRNALNAAIAETALSVGIKPSLAQKLIVQDEVAYDADGRPTNVDKLLKDLVKAHPELTGATPGGNAVNPGRQASGSTVDRETELRQLLTTQTFNPFGLDNVQQNPVVIRS